MQLKNNSANKFSMHFSFLTILIQYYAPVLTGVIAGLICKAYFVNKMQHKINDCEDDLMKAQEKVFELEALNEDLKNRLKEMENYFSKDRIIMN